MGAEYLTTQVDGEQFFNMGGCDIGEWAGFGQAGVVDQHIQPAEEIGGGLHDFGAYGGRLGEIALNGGGCSASRLNLDYGCGCAFVAVGVVADHGCALAGQFHGDALADSAAIDTGYECPFAGKRIVAAHIISPACVLSVWKRDAEGALTPPQSFEFITAFNSAAASNKQGCS